MLEKENLCFLGTLVKTQGIHGYYVLKLNALHAEDITKMESVFIEIDGLLVPFFIYQYSEINQSSLLIKFDYVDSLGKAKEFIGCNIYVPTEIVNFSDDLYSKIPYFLGYYVVDKKQGNIGRIIDIMDIQDNPLLKVKADKNEYLIPINNDIIQEINDNEKTIFTNIPDGLLDI
jgi:16S rRNA processing protein RimM